MATIPLKTSIVPLTKSSIDQDSMKIAITFKYNEGTQDGILFTMQDYIIAESSSQTIILKGIKEMLKVKGII